MQYLKQGTAITLMVGPFVDATDGDTAETGLTLSSGDFRFSKNGAAFVGATASASHSSGGWYTLAVGSGTVDTLGRLTMYCHESGALMVWREFLVVTAHFYDTLFGTDTFEVNVMEWASAAVDSSDLAVADKGDTLPANFSTMSIDANGAVIISSGTSAGQIDFSTGGMPKVDVIQISSSATAANNLEALAANISGGAYTSDAYTTGWRQWKAQEQHLVSTGTGAGQLSVSSGIIQADAIRISGSGTAADNLEAVMANVSGGEYTSAAFATGYYTHISTGVWQNHTLTNSTITPSTALDRIYRLLNNKMNINDASGEMSLRNEADTADIATGTITDDGTTTIRSKITWL